LVIGISNKGWKKGYKMKINDYKYFLFDIEGTVAPISFVHTVLFPYSKKNMKPFLEMNPLSSELYQKLFVEYSQDLSSHSYSQKLDQSTTSLLDYLFFLVDVDRKSPVLKELQGEIWKNGYESGEIKSNIFSDTLDFFKAIKNDNHEICIYSSGSILAQKLIFKYSNLGDLSQYISKYFDTGVGSKREEKSYLNILNHLNAKSDEVVFFTDIYEEAHASSAVGITPYILMRDGNVPITQNNYTKITNFKEWE
jgi:enolase-phosphatase E1